MLKGAIRMPCARAHIGASVCAVNRPASTGPSAKIDRPAVMTLSNRASSQISDTRSTPDTTTEMPLGGVSLKIGPYSRARDIRLSIGCDRSMARTFPINGSPGGPGKSSGASGSVMQAPLLDLADVPKTTQRITVGASVIEESHVPALVGITPAG